ncbi:MAG: transporter ATP-binding protein [Frankiales bacterium]|nr:transporter ATP-binding protein [Frankiales bacterium]
MTPALEVAGLRAAYGGVEVLHGIDLVVARGGLTAVLGPSGCGKTTLLRAVAGFVRPTAGTVTLDGVPVAGPGLAVPPQRRRVGYVPQEGALFPHLSVADNIAFGLPRAQRRSGQRVSALLDLVGLPAQVRDRAPSRLSGGQQQRVALARALAPEPALVLLDEPFSSLDAGLREETGRAVAAALRASGASGVLVTHDQGEALSLADSVAVVLDGRLVQTGSPAQVYGAPVDPDVAAFLGDAVLLPGTAGGPTVSCALGLLPLDTAATGEVRVLVRPERLLLGAGGVYARVVDVAFYGHDAAVRLTLADGLPVTARVGATAVPEVGDEVTVRVDGAVRAYRS